MKKAILFLILVVLPAFASAQTTVTPKVSLTANFAGQIGYKQPGIGFGAGMEISSPTIWASFGGGFNPTDKVLYGNTDTIGGGFEVLGRLPSGFLAGGGWSYTKLTFYDLNTAKVAMRPSISLGWETQRFRILVSRSFVGQEEANHSEGFSVGIQTYINRKLRFQGDYNFMTYDTVSYHPEQGRSSGVTTTIGLVYLPFR